MPFETLEAAQVASMRLTPNLSLQAILLRGMEWIFPEANIPSGLPITFVPHFNVECAVTATHMFYKLHADIAATVPVDIELCRLKATFQLVYVLANEYAPTTEEVEAFGSTSMIMMAFPYVRNLLQDTSGRSGLPGLLLPPFHMPMPSPQASGSIPNSAAGRKASAKQSAVPSRSSASVRKKPASKTSGTSTGTRQKQPRAPQSR